MAKIYSKNTWVDEVLAGSERYDILADAGAPIASTVQINLSTAVAVAGSAVDADKMNNIEDGIDALDTLVSDGILTSAQRTDLTDGGETTLHTHPGAAGDGWSAAANTWTYSAADAPTFVISVNADMTGVVGVGTRIKLTQTTAKYFIVTAVGAFSAGATLITVYGGTDYTLANAAITSPYYSFVKCPLGFPVAPAKWSVTLTDTTDRTQATPTNGTVYNPGSLSIVFPVGVWDLSLVVAAWASSNAAQTSTGLHLGLSTANNSFSDTGLKGFAAFVGASASLSFGGQVAIIKPGFTVTSKTTYYVVYATYHSNMANIILYNSSIRPLEIALVCAYL
jgi:hypothetical protein